MIVIMKTVIKNLLKSATEQTIELNEYIPINRMNERELKKKWNFN